MPHAWRIAQREIDRHVSRRGGVHAWPVLAPARTALVVIDMVPFFTRENPVTARIVPVIAGLAAALRPAGVAIAWVVPAAGHRHPEWSAAFHGPGPAAAYAASGGEGPVATRLAPGLVPAPGDILAEKTAASAFFPGACPLDATLRGRGIDTVLLAGTVTNVCVESSARDAATLGYRTVVIPDATAARNDDDHNASLHVLYRSFADIRPAADLIALLAPARSV